MAKKTEKTPLKKGVSQFTIIGKAKVGDNTFSIDNESQTSDWIYSQMQLGVDVGNGVVFSNLMGGYGATRDNIIYVHGVKKDEKGKLVSDYENRFEIDWDDRFDDKILETIGEDCFIRVGIEKDSKGKTYVKKFLSAYDAVEYLSEHLTDGTIVNVTGNLQYQYYNDNVSVQKNIKNIYLSTKTEEKDFKAEFRQTILLDADSIGKFDREKNTYPIDAYVVDYVGKVDGKEVKQNVAFPKTFYFDVLDVENPEKTAKLLAKYFKAKKDKILELGVIGTFSEGGVVSTATIDDLDEDIKDMIEFGMLSEEEALAKYTNGQKDRRMVIKQFITKNDSDDTEKKQLVIMRDEDKYTSDDLVFISQFIDTDDDDEEEVEEVDTDTDNTNDEDEDDFLKALGLV